MNNPPRSPSDGFRPTPIIVRRADGKLWNAIGIALFALGLITIFVLWSQGCAESSLAKRIDLLNSQADTALVSGDEAKAASLRDEARQLEAGLPAAADQDAATWGTVGTIGGLLVGVPGIGTDGRDGVI